MERKRAIEILRKEYDPRGCDETLRKALETLIPELAESEDERLRKLLVWQVHRNIEDETNDLKGSVYDGIKGHDPDLEESIEDWKKCLAYLEKQKEPVVDKEGLYYYLGGKFIYCGYPATEENPYDFAMSQQEKQKEQKPVDMKVKYVYPKFRIGDIISNNKPEPGFINDYTIVGFNNELPDYLVDGGNVPSCSIGIEFIDSNYHLKEQKPLSTEETELNSLAFLSQMGYTCIPPKKEHQRDSGAPKNALVGALNSPSDKDKNLDDIAQDYVEAVKEYNPEPTWDLMQTAVCYGYHYREGEEQKPASTEDMPYITDEHFFEREPADSFRYKLAEYMTKNCRKEESPDGYTYHISAEIILKMAEEELLKRGVVQKPAEWSEGDEKNIGSIADRLDSILDCSNATEAIKITKEIAWLKSLRPQPKVELSEDVKKTLDEVSHILIGLNYKQVAKDYKQAVEKLLSPRPSWKPSEEQIAALKWQVEHPELVKWRKGDLESLLEQLKKLI